MHRIRQCLADLADERQFKHAPEGWIFRAPTPWVHHPHYLVSETQMAHIKMVLGAGTLAALLFAALAAIGWVLLPEAPWLLLKALLVSDNPLESLTLLSLLIGLLIGGLQNLWNWFALRGLLKDLPRTAERITFAERVKALPLPVGNLKFAVVACLVGFLFAAYQALTATALSVVWYASGALCAWMAAYFGAILWIQRPPPAGPWSTNT